MRLIEVGEQSRLFRLPAQRCLRPRARAWNVHAGEPGKPAEMSGRLVRWNGDDGHAEPAADHFGDRLERNALIGDGVIAAVPDPLFEREAIEPGGIAPMHAGPAVAALSDIGRDAFFAGEIDQMRHETMIARAMRRWRKPHGRSA